MAGVVHGYVLYLLIGARPEANCGHESPNDMQDASACPCPDALSWHDGCIIRGSQQEASVAAHVAVEGTDCTVTCKVCWNDDVLVSIDCDHY